MKHNKGYKRSWRNLLLNKRYQLRFTLTMVGLSALLMGLLGWWVMAVAEDATEVAINNVLTEEVCKEPAAAAEAPAAAAEAPAGAAEAPAAAAEAPAAAAEAPLASDDPEAEGDRPSVTLEESEMELIEPPRSASAPPDKPAVDLVAARAKYEVCRSKQLAQIRKLEDRKRLIFWVLIGVGTALVLGLLLYGIKTTHHVAGPLHKVTLYMDKLRDGRYDTVYNLRKGDQLVEFYEHFKKAHAGLTQWEEEDVARLEALIGAAEEADLASRSPEAAAALAELRTALERKLKGLGKEVARD